MTEDAKPGLSFKQTEENDAKNTYTRSSIDDATINLFEEADLGRLVRLNHDESNYDDGGLGFSDTDGFDDGSLF